MPAMHQSAAAGQLDSGISQGKGMTQRRRDVLVLERQQTVDKAATPLVEDLLPSLLEAAVGSQPQQDPISTAVVDAISTGGVATVTVRGEARPCEASSLLQFPTAAAASQALLGRTVLVLRVPQSGPVILGIVAR